MSNLIDHVRQYRHNNDSGFVTAYEREGIEKLVAGLNHDIAVLRFDKCAANRTKREHFAGLAMQGMSSHPDFYGQSTDFAEIIARDSVKLADALLKELDK
jgi:hypothetical protein